MPLQRKLIKNAMPTLAKDTKAKLVKILIRNANDAASLARQLAPVDTGYMRSSIAVSQSSGGVVRLEVGAYYAHFVEYGTIYQSPQPFLGPAMQSVKKSLNRDLSRLLGSDKPGLAY